MSASATQGGHNYIHIYYTLLSGTRRQVRRVNGVSCMIAQTTRTCARMCLLGLVDMTPHLGGQIPLQNPNFAGVNRHFQAKLAKSKNMHIIKTLTPIPTKFYKAIKTTECPPWVV